MRSLQPGEAETSLFIVIFLNALPRNAKDAALPKAPNLDEMAKAADVVLSIPDSRMAAVQLVDCDEDADDHDEHVDAIMRRSPSCSGQAPSSSSMRSSAEFVCSFHRRFKEKAYKCGDPDRCSMKNVLRPKPPAGNAKAGRQ